METIKLGVEGMHCKHCVMAVKNAVGALPGVASVDVSLEQKLATVSYDPTKVALPAMKTAIENEGYSVP
jgi:copper chaperone